jgi:DNA polymerase-3 subunit delta
VTSILVRGDDPVLRDRAVDAVVAELVGTEDRGLVVAEITVPGASGGADDDGPSGADGRAAAVGEILFACQSPPFMTARRVVVVRDIGHLTASDAAPIVAYLDDPLETTDVVFVAGGGKAPDALTKKLKAVGAREHGPASSDTAAVLATECAAAGIHLRPGAQRAVVDRLGEDAGRVPALVEMLLTVHGPGADLEADDVAPYLGEAGAVPIYTLTNAVERGDVAEALAVLDRLLHASGAGQTKPLHPLQILATLHNHVRRLARLDDPAVTSVADAIEALGGRVKEFPARKAWEGSQRLGTDGIRRAYDALATADLDLKGARALPAEVVAEILVTRLTALSGRGGGRRRESGSGGPARRRGR